MSEYIDYIKKTITSIRPITEEDILDIKEGKLKVEIAEELLEGGSPKVGDVIARNKHKKSHMWLLDAEYFTEHYKKHSWA